MPCPKKKKYCDREKQRELLISMSEETSNMFANKAICFPETLYFLALLSLLDVSFLCLGCWVEAGRCPGILES